MSGEVWVEAYDIGDFARGLPCDSCGEATPPQHLHIRGDLYQDQPYIWLCFCSEGCAIALIKERGYTVVSREAYRELVGEGAA